MTQMKISGDIAKIEYSLKGGFRVVSYVFILLFILGYIAGSIDMFVAIPGIVIFGGINTYRVESVINRRTRQIDHLMKVFGLPFVNTFNIDDVKLVSLMHRGNSHSPSYPVLWLRQEDGKKYKVGEFPGHDDAELVRDILDFCKIRFDGYEY
ncbi:hypothetical protein [Kaarinaea lacus]